MDACQRKIQHSLVAKRGAVEPDCLGFSLSTTYLLCNPGQVTSPLRTSFLASMM